MFVQINNISQSKPFRMMSYSSMCELSVPFTSNDRTSFTGNNSNGDSLGDSFVYKAKHGSVEGTAGARDFIKQAGIARMGYIPVSKVVEIISKAAERIRSDQATIKDKENTITFWRARWDNKENDLNVKASELEERKNQVAEKENELKKVEKHLRIKTRNDETKKIRQELEQSYANRRQELEDEMANRAKALDARDAELQKRFDAYDEFVELVYKDVRTQLEQEYADRENTLANEEQKLMERCQAFEEFLAMERKELASNMRVLYDKDDLSVTTYNSFGEQMLHIANLMNKHSVVFTNPDKSTAMELLDILSNKEGNVPADLLHFLDRVFSVKELHPVSMDTIKDIIYSVLDDEGRLDTEKAATFIGIYSIKNEFLGSTLDFMRGKYPNDITVYPSEKKKHCE